MLKNNNYTFVIAVTSAFEIDVDINFETYRCIPEGMTKLDLVDLLSRLTVHMDEELRG